MIEWIVIGLILFGCMWAYVHLLRAVDERDERISEFTNLVQCLQRIEGDYRDLVDSQKDLEAEHERRERRLEERVTLIENLLTRRTSI